MKKILFTDNGFQHLGVTKPVNICTYYIKLSKLLKTASGFEANVAVIFTNNNYFTPLFNDFFLKIKIRI
jgi:hypothetical protein